MTEWSDDKVVNGSMSDPASGPAHDHAKLANDASNLTTDMASEERAVKRLKSDASADSPEPSVAERTVPGQGLDDAPVTTTESDNRRNGLAPIKKEYLLDASELKTSSSCLTQTTEPEASNANLNDQFSNEQAKDKASNDVDGGKRRDRKNRRKGGQNTERSFGRFDDAMPLCNSRAFYPEFSPRMCRFGDRCNLCHDIRQYLENGRRDDVDTFDGKCPVFEEYGHCPSGWKCRFVKSHMKEIEHEDGRKELVLVSNKKSVNEDEDQALQDRGSRKGSREPEDARPAIYNVVSMGKKISLSRKRLDFTKADEYIQWMNEEARIGSEFNNRRKQFNQGIEDLRARYVDPPFLPSEKRRLYFGPETPTLAPLTTQGNLPFRRLCVELGCQLTYSEMAMGMPLLQGAKADWTLVKAHESEIQPPKFTPSKTSFVFDNYDHGRDLKFGVQISSNQPWIATKAADVLNRFCPHLRLIDLNCGCPIDMIFKSGGGSALLESQSKMERMIRGMNAMSGEIPITAKIRTGVKSNRPLATQVLGRLAFGGREHRARLGAPGCAAVTLHGRSREQRYTKKADWAFIAECAAMIKIYNGTKDAITDTEAQPDDRTLPNAKDGRMYFVGNGDCYSHIDYFDHVQNARVDTVMIGRGALIKPWIFEEIEKGQYLDKSSSERLRYIEKFVKFGLDAWGSDEVGIGFTRRFLLEWLSFSHRYVPIGLLEHLPPSLNDRPPAYQGRDELETLMASTNYQDWIKLSEMFLGPVHPGFKFQPKHKSNAYEAEG
ncbi:hypothetical protein CDD81_1899 [Ophiocordyceps australis]|uniref:tRNA-dihydrouridine(47) synthase [NAD(P)(+)] n=1 Tax=Ophiocordyceps australis TaxID=1399860 RepID=A0A2C5Y070_9HYPO|nr:hypothetical protein CDD81_1899 [Ophiocordyceps australis]